jgi:hypothetical protein
LNKALEHIDIVNIYTGGGIAKSKSSIFVWEEKQVGDLSKVVKEKNGAKKEASPVEKPKEEKKAEDKK